MPRILQSGEDVAIDELEIFGNSNLAFNNGDAVSLTLDEDAAATSINDLLAVTDSDSGQTLTWTVNTGPSNGTLSGFDTTATSNGGSVTPTGLTYQPNANIDGSDSFSIDIDDDMVAPIPSR